MSGKNFTECTESGTCEGKTWLILYVDKGSVYKSGPPAWYDTLPGELDGCDTDGPPAWFDILLGELCGCNADGGVQFGTHAQHSFTYKKLKNIININLYTH